MKKITYLLVLVMSLTLFACSNATEETSQGKEGGDTIRFALNANFPPYEYYDGDKMVGIDIDLANKIGEKLGKKIEFQDMKFDNILASVSTGKVDAGISGITKNEDRAKSVDFSIPYQTSKQAILVGENSDIKGAADLEGKKIGAQVGTTGDDMAIKEYGTDFVQSFDNPADAVLALSSNKLDAVIVDEEPAKKFAEANEGVKLLDEEYAVEEYCIIFNKDNTALREEVDKALQELIDDGTVEEIINSYIGN